MVTTSSQKDEKKKSSATMMNSERTVLSNLLQAALQGDLDRLQRTVTQYCQQHMSTTIDDVLLQFKDANKRTVIHFACCCQKSSSSQSTTDATTSQSSSFVRELLDWMNSHCTSPNITIQTAIRLKDKQGMTPLMLAAQHCGTQQQQAGEHVGDAAPAEDAVLCLLEHASSSTITDPHLSSKLGLARSHDGATALHYAAGAGAAAKIIRAIYAAGPLALETPSKRSGTPLHWACSTPHDKNYSETIMSLLDDCGANINGGCAVSNTGSNNNDRGNLPPPPLCMAMAAGNTAHVELLLQQAIHNNNDNSKKGKNSSFDLTPSLLYVVMPARVTALHMAADMNMVGAMALLVQLIQQMNDNNSNCTGNQQREHLLQLKDHDGYTALDLATKENHVECVLLLLPLYRNTSPESITKEDATQYIQENRDKLLQGNKQDDETILGEQKTTSVQDDGVSPDDEEKWKMLEEKAKNDASAILAAANATTYSQAEMDNAVEFKNMGNKHYSNKDWEQAVDCYSQAIQCHSNEATYYSNRSACYVMLHQPDKALYDAIVARTLRSDWPKAAYRVAVARLECGLYEDAAVAAWEGLQLDESNDELKSLLQKCVKRGRKDHQAKQKARGTGSSGSQ